ncbi:MAG TPA: TfuA-like protein [Candidatus Baltobacteraceae bacterium]|nr:TfuA-like protein [Candidatus Baltobacteraceae bacterium]
MKLVVFAGPSLPPEDRIRAERVTYVPPAARGDVLRASESHDAILLVDGVFHHDLAPSPKEIYEVCQRVQFFGAASMGALRAAECASYGAVPLGAIARWYASEAIDGDDEVAVLVDPRTYRALTVPSVNVRYVARRAARRGILTAEEAVALVTVSREIFYMERSWDEVVAAAPRRVRVALRDIAENEGDLKRLDARFALRSVLRRLGVGGRKLPGRAGDLR